MTVKITKKTVDEVLSQIKSEVDADYKYPGFVDPETDERVEDCVYTAPDGSACCLVGKVLDMLDLPRPEWSGAAGLTGMTENGKRFESLPISGRFTNAALARLVRAQDAQDAGKTWHEAIG